MELASKEEFREEKKKGPLLIDFYTAWCGPCVTQSKILEECGQKMVTSFPNLSIHKVNIEGADFFTKLADRMGINSIPQLVLFNDGKYHMMVPGVKNAESIIEFLKKYLGKEERT